MIKPFNKLPGKAMKSPSLGSYHCYHLRSDLAKHEMIA